MVGKDGRPPGTVLPFTTKKFGNRSDTLVLCVEEGLALKELMRAFDVSTQTDLVNMALLQALRAALVSGDTTTVDLLRRHLLHRGVPIGSTGARVVRAACPTLLVINGGKSDAESQE